MPTSLPPKSHTLLNWACAYLLLGLMLGLYMAITHDHNLQTVHVHGNLLGWASLGLCSFAYAVLPSAATSRAAALHVGLHLVGLPIMLASLAALRFGVPEAAAGAGLGGVMLFVGLTCFALSVWRAR